MHREHGEARFLLSFPLERLELFFRKENILSCLSAVHSFISTCTPTQTPIAPSHKHEGLETFCMNMCMPHSEADWDESLRFSRSLYCVCLLLGLLKGTEHLRKQMLGVLIRACVSGSAKGHWRQKMKISPYFVDYCNAERCNKGVKSVFITWVKSFTFKCRVKAQMKWKMSFDPKSSILPVNQTCLCADSS